MTITISDPTPRNVEIPDEPQFRYLDAPDTKRVRAFIVGTIHSFVLWQGPTYDAIGDWSQAQADTAAMAWVNAHAAN